MNAGETYLEVALEEIQTAAGHLSTARGCLEKLQQFAAPTLSEGMSDEKETELWDIQLLLDQVVEVLKITRVAAVMGVGLATVHGADDDEGEEAT